MSKTSYIDEIQFSVKRDVDYQNVNRDNDEEIAVIFRSCDVAAHPVARCCDGAMLMKSIGIFSKSSMNENKRN